MAKRTGISFRGKPYVATFEINDGAFERWEHQFHKPSIGWVVKPNIGGMEIDAALWLLK